MTTTIDSPISGFQGGGLPRELATDLAIHNFDVLQNDVLQHAAALESGRYLIGENKLREWYDELEVGVSSLTTALRLCLDQAETDQLDLQAFVPSGAAVSRRRQLQPLIDDYGLDVTGMSMRSGHRLTIPSQQITAAQALSQGDRQTRKAAPVLNLRVRTSVDKPSQIMGRDKPGEITEQPPVGRWYGLLLKVSDVSLRRLPAPPLTLAER